MIFFNFYRKCWFSQSLSHILNSGELPVLLVICCHVLFLVSIIYTMQKVSSLILLYFLALNSGIKIKKILIYFKKF